MKVWAILAIEDYNETIYVLGTRTSKPTYKEIKQAITTKDLPTYIKFHIVAVETEIDAPYKAVYPDEALCPNEVTYYSKDDFQRSFGGIVKLTS